MGSILILIGFIIGLIFVLQILILAFKESRVWFIGSLIIPFVMLIFVIMHWEKAKSPFLKGLIAIPFYVIGAIMVGSSTQ